MGRILGKGNESVMHDWPHALFDEIRKEFSIKSEAKLAEFLTVSRPWVSKVRHGTNEVTAELILKVYHATKWSIEKIEKLAEK